VLFVLPSLFILIALSWVYIAFGEMPLVAGLFYGIKPAVTAIVVQAAHRIGSRALKNNAVGDCRRVLCRDLRAAAAVPADRGRRRAHRLLRRALRAGQVPRGWRPWRPQTVLSAGRDRRRHAHAGACPFRWARLLQGALIGRLLLWAMPMGAAHCRFTAGTHTLTQMGWFFTKAALLTFGGAYAVLPYVYQGAVGALRLAHANPDDRRAGARRNHAGAADHGGGLRRLCRRLRARQVFGPDSLFLAGAVAASLVTWFTFLPSFLFILAGGRWWSRPTTT
jgi:chromate transporter